MVKKKGSKSPVKETRGRKKKVDTSKVVMYHGVHRITPPEEEASSLPAKAATFSTQEVELPVPELVNPEHAALSPEREKELLTCVANNIFPEDILGPQVVDLIHAAKQQICADKRYTSYINSGFSATDMIRAAVVYSVTGSVATAAKITSLPVSAIRAWKYRPWWAACLRVARHYNTVETDIDIRNLRNMAIKTLQNRLQCAESLKTNDLIQTLRVAESLVSANDKRLGPDPTQQEAVISSLDTLKAHMKELSSLYKAKDITGKVTVTREET